MNKILLATYLITFISFIFGWLKDSKKVKKGELTQKEASEFFKARCKAVLFFLTVSTSAVIGGTFFEKKLMLATFIPAIITALAGTIQLIVQKINMEKWSYNHSFGHASGCALWLMVFTIFWIPSVTLDVEMGLIGGLVSAGILGIQAYIYLCHIFWEKEDEQAKAGN